MVCWLGKAVLTYAGVVHDIKSQYNFISLLCIYLLVYVIWWCHILLQHVSIPFSIYYEIFNMLVKQDHWKRLIYSNRTVSNSYILMICNLMIFDTQPYNLSLVKTLSPLVWYLYAALNSWIPAASSKILFHIILFGILKVIGFWKCINKRLHVSFSN